MSWGYCCHNGPSTWKNIAEAANGTRQSPIDVNVAAAEFDSQLMDKPLKIDYSSAESNLLVNTGSSIQMKFSHRGPSLSGGPINGDHAVAQFHFHWGKSSDHGSEHTVDGGTYAAECHIVHFNKSKYADISEAVNQPDGLCVLGMFVKVGKEHDGLKDVISSIDKIVHKDQSVPWSCGFDPACLLPSNTSDYWTYPGSLTTPPCYESVTWIVFKEPIELSEEQMLKLRSMKSFEEGSEKPSDELQGQIIDNFRPPQPLHSRHVKASFMN